MKRKLLLNHYILPISACLLWSTAFAGVKFGLTYMTPLCFGGVRFFMAGLVVLTASNQWRRLFQITSEQFKFIFMVSIFQTFLLYGFFHMGMTMVPGALGAIIVGASPLFSALAAHWMIRGDQLNFQKVFSIIVGIAGVVLISLGRKPWQASGSKELIGILLLVVSCFSSAIGNVLVSKDKLSIPPLLFNGLQIGIGGFLLFLISLPLEGVPNFKYPPSFYLVFGWLVLIASVSFSIWFYLLKQPGIKVSELNLWKFIIPLFGALFSWLLLPDESPDLLMILGMILVSSAIIVFYLRRQNS